MSKSLNQPNEKQERFILKALTKQPNQDPKRMNSLQYRNDPETKEIDMSWTGYPTAADKYKWFMENPDHSGENIVDQNMPNTKKNDSNGKIDNNLIRRNLLGKASGHYDRLDQVTAVWKSKFKQKNGREPQMDEVMDFRERSSKAGNILLDFSNSESSEETTTTEPTGYEYPGNATPAQTPMQKALGTNEMSKDIKESVTEENTYSEPKMHVIRNSVDPVYIPTETAARGGWEKLFFGAEGPAAEVHKTNVLNANLYGQYAQMNSPQVQMEQPKLMSRKASTISNALSQQQKAIDEENKFKPVSEPTISGVTRNGQAAITHSVSYNNLNEPLLFLEPQKIDFSPEEWKWLKSEISYDDAYGEQLKLAMDNKVEIMEDKAKGSASLKITQGRLIPDQKWLDYFNNLVVKVKDIPQIAKGTTPGSNPLTGAVKGANDSISK